MTPFLAASLQFLIGVAALCAAACLVRLTIRFWHRFPN
jgi:hypothetical protein